MKRQKRAIPIAVFRINWKISRCLGTVWRSCRMRPTPPIIWEICIMIRGGIRKQQGYGSGAQGRIRISPRCGGTFHWHITIIWMSLIRPWMQLRKHLPLTSQTAVCSWKWTSFIKSFSIRLASAWNFLKHIRKRPWNGMMHVLNT